MITLGLRRHAPRDYYYVFAAMLVAAYAMPAATTRAAMPLISPRRHAAIDTRISAAATPLPYSALLLPVVGAIIMLHARRNIITGHRLNTAALRF